MQRDISRLFCFSLLSGSCLFAQPPRYIVNDLGPLNGGVSGINIRGQVIGSEALSDGRARAFRTAPNSAINWTTDDLGSLGGSTTTPVKINASGQVAGTGTVRSGESRGFRTAPNKSIQPETDDIGTLGGSGCFVSGLNDSGQVTGTSNSHAFVTGPNRAINPATDVIDVKLGVFQIDSSGGRDINNRGHVLGSLSGYPFYPTAFLRVDRLEGPLPITSYIWQTFVGLTEQDQIVFNTGKDLQMWQNGKSILLATCASACLPRSVNNSLHIVGATEKNPFLYAGGTIYDLTTLIPSGSGWTLADSTASWSINDLGQIAGIGRINNETHAIRLDPVASVASAIQQALNMVQSLHLNMGRKSSVPAMLKLALASKLKAALESSTRSSPGATRGLLSEFENLVRAHAGQSLTHDQANRLLQMAEAAYDLT